MVESSDTETFAGGVNQVVRVSDRVLRPAGPWTPAVHALLDHLAAAGFGGAPRAHGLDPEGREILDFIPGDVPDSEYICSDAALRDIGVMLRAMHEATTDFVPPEDARWYLPARDPADVVCHGDIAPYNTVFRDGLPVAFIDFDTAHPAPRIWDVAYAAFRFVPLVNPTNPDCPLSTKEQAARLRILADAYDLTPAERHDLPDVAQARLHAMATHIREQAAAGHPAFSTHLAEGHDTYYLGEAEYISAHASQFRAALA